MVATLVLGSGAVASQSQRSDQQTTGNAARAVIPFELVNRHVVLSVMVSESRPLKFLLDTGNKFAIDHVCFDVIFWSVWQHEVSIEATYEYFLFN